MRPLRPDSSRTGNLRSGEATSGSSITSVLDVAGLSIAYSTDDGRLSTVVWDLGFSLFRGEILGLAGESGSGKSTAALTSIGYRSPAVRVLNGSSMVDGTDLLKLPLESLRDIWGTRIAYVSQHAAGSLNPALPIGKQMAQPLITHLGLRGAELEKRLEELLRKVRIGDPQAALRRYPFQFSGGQQQRISIGIALACDPEVVVFDEPTTGLDVTTQAEIVDLIRSLVHVHGMASLFVSHDIALLKEISDRLAVMYAGQIVEQGGTELLFATPSHPYTRGLITSAPRLEQAGLIVGMSGQPPSSVISDACSFIPRCPHAIADCGKNEVALTSAGPDHLVRCIRWQELPRLETPSARKHQVDLGDALLNISHLQCSYDGGNVLVVNDVSLDVRVGEIVGIVGESGSGKSTLLRAVAGLHTPEAGDVELRGTKLHPRAVRRPRHIRREIQLVFQNPDSSLNPRHPVKVLVGRAIKLFSPDASRQEVEERIAGLLDDVMLPKSFADRYPSELSGGQKQRVALARAFAANPSLLLCDEVTSSLDVSVQAVVLRVIVELAEHMKTAVVLVTHDLAVVRSVAPRTIVMREGRICEEGTSEAVLNAPQHPYTKRLLNSIPRL